MDLSISAKNYFYFYLYIGGMELKEIFQFDEVEFPELIKNTYRKANTKYK
jgi:hypothetical protein